VTIDFTRVPVIAGAGQHTNREANPTVAPDPFDLMETAARTAAASALLPDGPAAFTHIWMVHSLSLRHADPAGALARRLGAERVEARCSGMGGSIPQWLVDRAADEVAKGGQPRILIVGAEALATRRRAKKAGVRLHWPTSEGWPETWPPIEADFGVNLVERTHGLEQATTMYALIESALAHVAGHDPATHRLAIGRLMERCNEVATHNPNAWFPTQRSADELTTVSTENRMICWPYPKYVNAVMEVDMAAAVVVTDATTARQWGLGRHEVAYIAGWADAKEVWYLSERPEVHRSPALAACTASALDSAGLGAEDIEGFDLYACFPSSIEVARQTLGLAQTDPRPLTLTGGLPYHGGPGSNYVTHALVNTLNWLRAGKGESVLVHGNGFFLTTHSVGVYRSNDPSAHAPAPDDQLQHRLDAAATTLPVDDSAEGSATVVAATVPYDRAGDAQAGIVLLNAGGRRTLARTTAELTAAVMETDPVGLRVEVGPAPQGPGNLAALG